jgi:energy-coupling factor transporter ATP-binding protein EcfA2
MKKPNIEKSAIVKSGKIETITDIESIENTNTDIITDFGQFDKKSISYNELLISLRDNFKINDIYYFFDIELGKFVKLDLACPYKVVVNGKIQYHIGRNETIIDKSNMKNTISTTLEILQKNNIIDIDIEINKDTINGIYNELKSVVRVFDRHEEQIFIRSDNYNFNDFIETDIAKFLVKEEDRISYNELLEIIETKYKRFNILLNNNVMNDKESFNWVINWLSCELNIPSEVNKTIMFIGEQGSGKSMFWEVFANTIYDKSNIAVMGNSNWIDKFNDTFMNKAFLINDEISLMGTDKDTESINNNIKGIITNHTMMIRGMNKSNKSMHTPFNMVFLTNNGKNPVKIESLDRRWAVFGRGLPLTDNEEFVKLNESTTIFREKLVEEMKELVFYIKQLQYERGLIIDSDKPIMTNIKKRIINETNDFQELIRSSFNKQDWDNFNSMISDYDLDSELYNKIYSMFNIGVFTNSMLKTLYCILYNVDNTKENDIKSSKFWNGVLLKPAIRSIVSINGTKHNIKVFVDNDIDNKIEKLQELYKPTLPSFDTSKVEIVYEDISKEEDTTNTTKNIMKF